VNISDVRRKIKKEQVFVGRNQPQGGVTCRHDRRMPGHLNLSEAIGATGY